MGLKTWRHHTGGASHHDAGEVFWRSVSNIDCLLRSLGGEFQCRLYEQIVGFAKTPILSIPLGIPGKIALFDMQVIEYFQEPLQVLHPLAEQILDHSAHIGLVADMLG